MFMYCDLPGHCSVHAYRLALSYVQTRIYRPVRTDPCVQTRTYRLVCTSLSHRLGAGAAAWFPHGSCGEGRRTFPRYSNAFSFHQGSMF